jgi:hypothetical protein
LLSPRVEADVAAEEQKMREAFAERKRQVELKKAQRLKDEEARLAVEASQGTTAEVHALTAFDSSHCNQFRPNYIIRFSPFSGTSATCCCAASSTAMTHRNNQG